MSENNNFQIGALSVELDHPSRLEDKNLSDKNNEEKPLDTGYGGSEASVAFSHYDEESQQELVQKRVSDFEQSSKSEAASSETLQPSKELPKQMEDFEQSSKSKAASSETLQPSKELPKQMEDFEQSSKSKAASSETLQPSKELPKQMEDFEQQSSKSEAASSETLQPSKELPKQMEDFEQSSKSEAASSDNLQPSKELLKQTEEKKKKEEEMKEQRLLNWIQFIFQVIGLLYNMFGRPTGQPRQQPVEPRQIPGCTGVLGTEGNLDNMEVTSPCVQQETPEKPDENVDIEPAAVKVDKTNIQTAQVLFAPPPPNTTRYSSNRQELRPRLIGFGTQNETAGQNKRRGPQPIEEAPPPYGIEETGLQNPRGGGSVQPIAEDPPYGIQEENLDEVSNKK
ncbi:uncharacterized protein [Antedon mediterranea]|uniref:uncharacterized protein isoform X2 n=1 Tax=Antedon mediterranea TaxID=105859 RepID=UPI003AF99960